MRSEQVRILDGNIFVLSDANGDIEPGTPIPGGFFSFDTRFLSKWVMTINGERVNALAVDPLRYFQVRFFLVPGEPTHYVDAKISVIRERSVAGSFSETVTVLNYDDEATELTIRLDADVDFLPPFLAREEQRPPTAGRMYRRVDDGQLRMGYRRENFWRETVLFSSEPADIDESGFTYHVRLEPHTEWSTDLDVAGRVLRPDGQDVRDHVYPGRIRRNKPRLEQDLRQWLDNAPALSCDWPAVARTYRQALVDLASLRYAPLTLPDQPMPAAGLPWVATITGRDSMLASLQTLPIVPDLAVASLRVLATNQGSQLDDFRDEEPGKILRELRYGEATAFEERPQSPYYGAADTTPLYVILLDEYERWSGDAALVREFEEEARAALHWIDEYGDLKGDGYVWYQRRSDRGVDNQCWKEAWNAISFRDGRIARAPLATCELQGYAYDAKVRGARLAREIWNDAALGDRLEREAADLKERFNRDFWIPAGEYYALALDGDGRQVDALASNMGHLLWTGIVDESRAEKVVEHLLGPALFSGWGVRTLAETEGRYNPLGYHAGTVWPFDNAFIAWGMRRYGFTREAGIIAEAIFDTADTFGGRLPEAYGGYDRQLTGGHPVRYPAANNPEAWSTGAPLLLLRALLGMEPYGDDLVVAPDLPPRFGRIELLDVPGRWGRIDVVGNAIPSPANGLPD